VALPSDCGAVVMVVVIVLCDVCCVPNDCDAVVMVVVVLVMVCVYVYVLTYCSAGVRHAQV